MATATAARGPHAEAGHVQRFEKKVNAVKQAVDDLPGDEYFKTLLGIIHRPGWTTIAEGLFFETVMDSMLAQTQQLNQLHKQLMAGATAVGQ